MEQEIQARKWDKAEHHPSSTEPFLRGHCTRCARRTEKIWTSTVPGAPQRATPYPQAELRQFEHGRRWP
jgi:hypothetical protein